MTADLPHTLYYKTDKNGKVIKPQSGNEDDEAIRLNNEVMRRKREKEKGNGVTLEQLFDDALNDND